MRALITGGAGFIGSNLADELLDQGWDVTIVDNLSTGREINLEGARAVGADLRVADITDADAMVEIVGDVKPDVVFHLAAQVDVRKAVAQPTFDARVNVEGTIAMLDAAHQAGVGRFIFTSTGGALYGEAEVLPSAETSPIEPLAPYGTSKRAAELYCELYARLHGLSTVSLRLANVYGPRQDPLGEAGVIAIFCGIANNGRVATVFGDGKQTRDYVYVGDVVAAFIAAAKSDQNGAFNIGTGRETTVLDLVEALELKPDFKPARLGEAQRSCLATDLATEELGFTAAVGLKEGLQRTLSYSS
jgi:UDP-glucose 4-epimerase